MLSNARRNFSWLGRYCRRRMLSYNATQQRPSSLYLKPECSLDPAVATSPRDLSPAQRGTLENALRVDQAGEVAANWIYKGQIAVLGHDLVAGPLIQDMWEQEKKHLAVMDKLLMQHRVRPTILSGVAKIGGFCLGATTALMGKEAAMACTEAVETVIGEHYDGQLKEMDEVLTSNHRSIPLLKNIVREFRDDEWEHLDIAVDQFSRRAPAHALLSSVIGVGCKVAIQLCKRI